MKKFWPKKWYCWDMERTSPGSLQYDNSFCWITAFSSKEDWKLLFLVGQKKSGCLSETLETQEHVWFFFHESIMEHPGCSFILLKGRWLTVDTLLSELPQCGCFNHRKPASYEWVRKTFFLGCDIKGRQLKQMYKFTLTFWRTKDILASSKLNNNCK